MEETLLAKNNNYNILIICVEGEECKTEDNFFNGIIDSSVRLIRVNNANKNTIQQRWEKYKYRFIDTLKELSSDDKKIKVYFIHDYDDPSAYESLHLTCNYFCNKLKETSFSEKLQIKEQAIYDNELSFDWFIATLFYPEKSLSCLSTKEKKHLAKEVVDKFNTKHDKYWSKIIKENGWEQTSSPANISYRNFLRNNFKEENKVQSHYWEIVESILEIIVDDITED